MNRRRWLWLGVGAALGAGLAVWILGGVGTDVDRSPPEVDATAAHTAAPRSAPGGSAGPDAGATPGEPLPDWLADVPAASRGPLPRSLRGTEVDSSLEVDAEGNFLPTPGVRRLFDYFLLAVGEEPDEVIRGRILLHLYANLPPRAAAQAAKLLDDFLALREAGQELVTAESIPLDLERRLQWIRELRRAHLGAETAQALYGEEDAVTLLDLERREVLLDESLTEAERAGRLEAIEARLPDRVREARRSASAPARLRAEVAALRSAGASEDEVFALREREFGREAAERLADLDRRRAQADRRHAEYRLQRDAILADPALDPEQRTDAVEALRAASFEPHEIVRIRALDRMETAPR
jgi:lipase chaperone LimK